MKIKLTYDAEKGIAIPDGAFEVFVDNLAKNGGELVFSTGAWFDLFRLYVKNGLINYQDVEVLYFKKETSTWWQISINQNGTCDFWPNGFCDKTEKILAQLINWS